MLALLLSLSLIVWAAVFIDASFGFKRLDRLEDSGSISDGPLLTVVAAARNEEAHLEESLKSQLNQSYKSIEWILVNDRSTDRTGKIMDAIQESDPRVRTIHIKSLPDGWLGKNHALYKGYQESSGELILFTDADVLFKKDAFGKAIIF